MKPLVVFIVAALPRFAHADVAKAATKCDAHKTANDRRACVSSANQKEFLGVIAASGVKVVTLPSRSRNGDEKIGPGFLVYALDTRVQPYSAFAIDAKNRVYKVDGKPRVVATVDLPLAACPPKPTCGDTGQCGEPIEDVLTLPKGATDGGGKIVAFDEIATRNLGPDGKPCKWNY